MRKCSSGVLVYMHTRLRAKLPARSGKDAAFQKTAQRRLVGGRHVAVDGIGVDVLPRVVLADLDARPLDVRRSEEGARLVVPDPDWHLPEVELVRVARGLKPENGNPFRPQR